MEKYDRYMLLNIYVDNDEELENKYKTSIQSRNEKMLNNSEYIDAGVDLFVPDNIDILMNTNNGIFKLNHKICCSAKMVTKDKTFNTGYYLYPRSSISNTPFRLANSVGIIDAGYRGNIIAALDTVKNSSVFAVEPYSRLVQICAPGLVPIIANVVDAKEELGSTLRGNGGFGSTGI
jgi:dUTP pyrophosphatase